MDMSKAVDLSKLGNGGAVDRKELELYDHEVEKITEVWSDLNDWYTNRPATESNIKELESRAQDMMLSRCGLIIEFEFDHGTGTPEIHFVARVNAESETDHERKAFEINKTTKEDDKKNPNKHLLS